MIEDIEKEDWRQYNTSREFSKDIKFNKKWYHLTALFDQSQDDFDFNDDGVDPDNEFDFNTTLDQNYEYNSDMYLGSIDFDFNSVLMEKYKITEIGLIMSKLNESQLTNIDLTNITTNIIGKKNKNNFLTFYNNINKQINNGFYIKTELTIFSKNDPDQAIASINEPEYINIASDIFQTILKAAGGHTNEASIQLLSNIDKNKRDEIIKKDKQIGNILGFLSQIKIINNINSMVFPDTVYINDDNINNVIPIDLKVANEGQINVASCNNKRMLSGIHNALLSIKDSNKTLMKYIQECTISLNPNNTLTSSNNIIPELKGFLLFSSTSIDYDKLKYNNIILKPLIACIHGRHNVKNDPLFASKSYRGTNSISYDNGNNNTWDKGGLLQGCPYRFAQVIYNFYNCLVNNNGEFYKNKNDIEYQAYDNLYFLLNEYGKTPELKMQVEEIFEKIK